MDIRIALIVGTRYGAVVAALHEIQNGRPAGEIEPILQHEAESVALNTIDADDALGAAVFRSVFGEAGHPFDAGELLAEIFHDLQREIVFDGFAGRKLCAGTAGFESNRLRPDLIFAVFQGREKVAAVAGGVDGGSECLVFSTSGNGNTFKRLVIGGFRRNPSAEKPGQMRHAREPVLQ